MKKFFCNVRIYNLTHQYYSNIFTTCFTVSVRGEIITVLLFLHSNLIGNLFNLQTIITT